MDDIDVWRAAHKMIDLYDLEAGWRAGLRADQLYEQGDVDGFHVWTRIVKLRSARSNCVSGETMKARRCGKAKTILVE